MARGAELRGSLLTAEVVDGDFKEIALHVGVFAEEVDVFDGIDCFAQCRAVGNDDGGIFKERRMEREFRQQRAQG